MGTTTIGALSVKITADTSGVKRGLKSTEKSLRNTERALQINSKHWENWSINSIVATVSLSVAIALTTRAVFDYSDSFTSMTNKLKLATTSTENLADVTERMFAIATETGSSVLTTTALFTKMERATRTLGVSQERLLKITSTINKAFAISGATTAEASGAILQLGQALASGVLRGQEYNSITEQAPIIMEAIMKSTGKTSGELRKLAETGAITAKILIESLERYSKKIDIDFAQSMRTFQQKMENAKTAAIKFGGASEGLTDIVRISGDAVLSLANNIDTLINSAKAAAAIYSGLLVSSITKSTIEKLTAAKVSKALAIEEIATIKSVEMAELSSAAVKSKAIASVAAAQVTETRVKLVSLIASQKLAVQSVIEARATDKKSIAALAAAKSQVTLAAADAKRTGSNTLLIAAETKLSAAQVVSAASSKKLVIAENEVSASTTRLAISKKAATAASGQLKTAKTASIATSAKLTVATNAETAATARSGFAARVAAKSMTLLRGGMALLGGPVGVLIAVVASLALFVDWETEAEKATAKLTKKIDKQIGSLKGLSAVQLQIKNLDFDGAMRSNLKAVSAVNEEIANATKKQRELMERFGQGTQGIKIQNAEIIALKEELKLLIAEQERLQKIGGAIFKQELEPKIPTKKQEVIVLDESARKKAADAIAKIQEKETKRFLNELRDRFSSTEELENARHKNELSKLKATFKEGAELTAQQMKSLQGLEQQHIDALKDIRQQPEFIAELQNRFSTEEELENQRFQNQVRQLKESFEKMAESQTLTAEQKEEHLRLIEKLETEHQENLKAIKNVTNFQDEVNARFATETELKKIFHAQEMEMLRATFLDKANLTASERELEKKLTTDHEKELTRIKDNEERVKLAITTSALNALSSALMIGGKKAQAIGKKFAIAGAIIKGKQAAVDAWQAGMSTGGPWAPFVAAAYTAESIARTAGMINSIRGGGSSSGGGGGGIPATPSGGNASPQQAAAPVTPRSIDVNFTGSGSLSMDQVRELIEQFNEALGDGAQLNIIGGS